MFYHIQKMTKREATSSGNEKRLLFASNDGKVQQIHIYLFHRLLCFDFDLKEQPFPELALFFVDLLV